MEMFSAVRESSSSSSLKSFPAFTHGGKHTFVPACDRKPMTANAGEAAELAAAAERLTLDSELVRVPAASKVPVLQHDTRS